MASYHSGMACGAHAGSAVSRTKGQSCDTISRKKSCSILAAIAQPAGRKQLKDVTALCRLHAFSQPMQLLNMTQQQQQQQQVPQPSLLHRRKQLVSNICCVATDLPASSDAAAAQAATEAGTGSDSDEQLSGSSSSGSSSSSSSSGSKVIDCDADIEQQPSQPDVRIKSSASSEEIQAVAQLRAEAYYAEDHSRFAQSFKRQFASQEVESLRQRTSTNNSRRQLCDCLVAVDSASGSVLGCIDIRLPQSSTGLRTIGVPEGDPGDCYLLNVVVAEGRRGEGIGRELMRAAMSRAVHTWGAERLYTHVEADNEVASALYKGCGFQEHSSEAKYASALSLGRLVLLMAEAAAVPAVTDTLWCEQE